MFSTRTIIWTILVIFLLPTDEIGKKELYEKVHATANMIGGACNKVNVCANFDPSWDVFAQKAQTGVDVIAQLIMSDDTKMNQSAPTYAAQRSFARSSQTETRQATQHNTLQIDDLVPAWRSPESHSYASR